MTPEATPFQPRTDPARAARQRLFWRVHFWAGLIVSPIVLFASLTGLLYVFTPQIEAWRHADVDQVAVPPGAQRLPLDVQVRSAMQAMDSGHAEHAAHAPAIQPRYVVPALNPGDTTQVAFKAHGPDHDHGIPQGSTVYVNPYTGEVVGQLADMARFKTWAKKLHSSALQGDGWRWLIELGASWMLVMLFTGMVMWWPRPVREGGPGWRALIPTWGRGRQTWRDLHASVAVLMSALVATILLTGLTWSNHAGDQFKALQKALHQESPRIPKTLQPAAQPGLDAMQQENKRPTIGWQQAYELATAQSPHIAMMMSAPTARQTYWKIDNFDRSQPQGRFTMALDAVSGKTLFYAGWAQMPALSRATAVGIPFHRGEFGVWNQALLVLVALSAMFSVVSGWVMWLKRRPAKGVGAPSMQPRQWREVPRWVWLAVAIMAVAMPVFAASALVLACVELGLHGLKARHAPASSA